jgi:hypothetical protein
MRGWFYIKTTNSLEALISVDFYISQYDWVTKTEVSDPMIFIIVLHLRILTRILKKNL